MRRQWGGGWMGAAHRSRRREVKKAAAVIKKQGIFGSGHRRGGEGVGGEERR